jgi:hypothetical protein
VHKRRADSGAKDEIGFGRPAADAVAGQMDRLNHVFATANDTLSRNTDEIDNDGVTGLAMSKPRVPRNPRRIDNPAQLREILLLAA